MTSRRRTEVVLLCLPRARQRFCAESLYPSGQYLSATALRKATTGNQLSSQNWCIRQSLVTCEYLVLRRNGVLEQTLTISRVPTNRWNGQDL